MDSREAIRRWNIAATTVAASRVPGLGKNCCNAAHRCSAALPEVFEHDRVLGYTAQGPGSVGVSRLGMWRLFIAGVAFAVLAAPAMAQQKCIAPAGLFELGQYSCLAVGPQSSLARCEMNLNVLSWKRVLDYCPGGAAQVPTGALASSCRANGQTFPVGGYACLTVAGQGHLARCDVVLNTPSWTTMQESCSAMPPPKAATSPPRPWFKRALDLPRGLFNTF